VYEGETALCSATYTINVLREIVTARAFGETSSDEGHEVIKGTIRISGIDIFDLIGRENLTLQLDDGRRLDFTILNRQGTIGALGGFYTPGAA